MYDTIAGFYRQLLEPRGHFSKQLALLKLIIEKEHLPPTLRILDAACGTGDVAALLYMSGFREIEAIDGSQAMIDQRDAEHAIPVSQVSWTDLPGYFAEHGRYDLIFLLGNSLAHAPVTLMPSLLLSLYEGLNAGGILLVDLRAWERNAGGSLVEPGRLPSVYRYLGRIEVLGHYYWLYDKVEYNNWTQKVTYRLQPVESVKVDSRTTETEVFYHIFDRQTLTEMLISAGFHSDRIETRSFPEWPYLVLVSKKNGAVEKVLIDHPPVDQL